MELIERAAFLDTLQAKFDLVEKGEGHSILLSGEAGIGKTALVKNFCKQNENHCNIFRGTCDALFIPRLLAPLYDIASQMDIELLQVSEDLTNRTVLFTRFFHELAGRKGTTVIVFEDIHWADEATLDFIKFLARRITQLSCLFILTYRDDEIHSHHPLRNVLGQLNPDSFTRIQLLPLSRPAVRKMAVEKGYSGEDVYSISGGNPFYVNEILASYSLGIPDNIKDAVLSVYNRHDGKTKRVWEILSVLPTGFEIKYLEKIEPAYADAIENCLTSKILIPKEGKIFFKHELYRRTIESSLSPLLRVALNKNILDLFLESFIDNKETERIIHHAKSANDYGLVVQYAPIAAKQAASVGAHIEASKLYRSAIEYYQGNDPDILSSFYEAYAYECYLINQIQDAIIYTGKSLNLWRKKNDIERIGNCLRFLSRLWWFEGNRKQACTFSRESIEILNDQPASSAKAMAFSNMAQLKMLSHQADECIFWGEKAIALAEELDDQEILSHALNNVGTVQTTITSKKENGFALLQQSLDIALKHGFHEHAARAYTNFASSAIATMDYVLAKKMLDEGLKYCEERDLDSWTTYMLSDKARLLLKTGDWNEAANLAQDLLKDEEQVSVLKMGASLVIATIKMRKGETDALQLLLELKEKAYATMELPRIIPALVALLEYEWITGKHFIGKDILDAAIEKMEQVDNVYENGEFGFWLKKTREQHLKVTEVYEGYQINTPALAQQAASVWEKMDCSFDQALCLFEGSDDDKRNAIAIVQKLGANAVYEKMKQEMRSCGIKSIPRGIRRTTQANPLHLTDRELDVLQLLNEGLQNKEIAGRIFISAKTVDHHISSILFKMDVNSRVKAVQKALEMEIIK